MAKRSKKKTSKKSWNVELPKIKVLAYCDSPTCATGFGTVSRNIFEGLQNTGRYQVDVLGINYWGDPHTFLIEFGLLVPMHRRTRTDVRRFVV